MIGPIKREPVCRAIRYWGSWACSRRGWRAAALAKTLLQASPEKNGLPVVEAWIRIILDVSFSGSTVAGSLWA
jgi:hypothetical protein